MMFLLEKRMRGWSRLVLFGLALALQSTSFVSAQNGSGHSPKYGSYDAFGDSIAEGCCVSGGTITETSVRAHVATIKVISGASQPVPKVGDLLDRVSGTTNAGGRLNFLRETPILGVGGNFANVQFYDGEAGTITGTVSFATTLPDTPPAEEKGSFRAVTYVGHVASVLGVLPANRSKSGTSCADVGPRVFARKVSSQGYALYTLEDGVNDMGAMNAGAPPTSHLEEAKLQFVRCAVAEDVFLATPANLVVLAKDAAAHAKGWRASTLQDPSISSEDMDGGRAPSFEMTSNTKGASFTSSVQGTAVVIGYEATPSEDGTAVVKVDDDREVTLQTRPPCMSPPVASVRLTRRGDIVTVSGDIPTSKNGWILVQGANDASFNGMFVLHPGSAGTAMWLQKGTDSETSAKAGPGTCAMTQYRYGRTFVPQGIVLGGLPGGKHKVVVTVTSESGTGHAVFLDYIAGNAGVQPNGGPTVVRVGVERGKARWISDELSGAFDSCLKASTSTLSSLGWNVRFADVRAHQDLANDGNISPYMFAEAGGAGVFTAGSTRVTNVDPALLRKLSPGTPLDDGNVHLPAASRVMSKEKDALIFEVADKPNAGALRSGTGYFDAFLIGVHPNNRGQVDYFAAAILQALQVKP